MKNQSTKLLLTPAEKSVKKRIDAWRKNRTGKAMPKALWQEVSSLVPGTTINRIAQMMGLNHTILKGHYWEWKTQNTGFVEVTTQQLTTTMSCEQRPSNFTIEITLTNGSQVTIRQDTSYESAGSLFKSVWNELQCSR